MKRGLLVTFDCVFCTFAIGSSAVAAHAGEPKVVVSQIASTIAETQFDFSRLQVQVPPSPATETGRGSNQLGQTDMGFKAATNVTPEKRSPIRQFTAGMFAPVHFVLGLIITSSVERSWEATWGRGSTTYYLGTLATCVGIGLAIAKTRKKIGRKAN